MEGGTTILGTNRDVGATIKVNSRYLKGIHIPKNNKRYKNTVKNTILNHTTI